METRLSLRRRLENSRLKQDDSNNNELPEDLELKGLNLDSNIQDFQVENTDELDGADEEDDDLNNGEGEDAEEDEASGNVSTNERESVEEKIQRQLKIMISRFPDRPPVVCFDYPKELQLRRVYPEGTRIEAISQSEKCQMYFQTHWERNCVKNAFASAGLTRTNKRNWNAAWSKHMSRAMFKKLKPFQKVSSRN